MANGQLNNGHTYPFTSNWVAAVSFACRPRTASAFRIACDSGIDHNRTLHESNPGVRITVIANATFMSCCRRNYVQNVCKNVQCIHVTSKTTSFRLRADNNHVYKLDDIYRSIFLNLMNPNVSGKFRCTEFRNGITSTTIYVSHRTP